MPTLTEGVIVLHVGCSGETGEQSCEDWQQQIEASGTAATVTPPRIVCIPSPYRFITSPILKCS